MRIRTGSVLGMAAALFLLSWLVGRIEDRSLLRDAVSQAFQNPGWLGAGLALFGLALACGTVRWVVLLRVLNLPISVRRALQLYAMGHFFNVAVPGSTGGDLVKASCAALDCPGRRPEAVASILAERVIGMLALVVLVASSALFRPSFYQGTREMQGLRVFALLLGAGVVAGLAVLLGVDWSRWMPEWSGGRGWQRAAALAVRAFLAVRRCASHPRALATTFALSVLNHLLSVACAWSLGRALGLDLRGAEYWTVIPLVNAVSSVPVTPGGAGIRETASVMLFAHVGVSEAEATVLSLLVYGVILAWALVGGLCYWLLREGVPAVPAQDSGTSRSFR